MGNSKYTLLENINISKDIKELEVGQLPLLCQELRSFIIEQLANNPGHLGSSLGVVELAVALHYVFDTPFDRIIWDVGHQAYPHKILTGRRDRFHTNRKFKGLSGFPSIKESEYDAFGVGHASTSISAGLGMSVAANLKGENRNVVAVIGDGSLTGGLAFEGLNNASIIDNNLLVIVNDNDMAIDPIKGGWNDALTKLHTSHTYNKVRYKLYQFLNKRDIITDQRAKKLTRFFNKLKISRSSHHNNIFEGLSIRYFGPSDGHDVVKLVEILQELKNHQKPRILHIITQKGKGYEPAEKEVTTWHAPGKFNPETGERNSESSQIPLYQDVFGETLLELAKQNPKIVGITPAMLSGCSMTIMQKEMPDRVFDVGIAEGHAVTFSAGLAKDGMMPFCNIYSSFMQRAYDNVIHDVALQKLNVVFCLDRAGIVGADGATHQGAFDLAYMRCVPNLTIAAPANEHELRNLMFTAQQSNMGAFVIRYPRGKGTTADWHNTLEIVEVGKGRCLKEGFDIAVLTIGTMANPAQKAIEMIESETNTSVAHYDMRFVKPLDAELLHEIGRKFKRVVTIEDGVIQGGFGSAVLEFFADNGYTPAVKRLGIPDIFVEHGTPYELHQMLGLDANGLKEAIIKI
ncbi:1-deoxy-D-xylulose-5-phosphate synthase [Porphyromonadaceae bacterium COT-184 OH4590]|nr:1-deoxy-D-xylulose-5-phosphate synthase [Porphyromonadaceae bacterium COT-184 OH4590]MDO4726636.1 1-deoxy-D-xylulose-5-phosphate synthase [Porphyromonadaceae bacterium]